MKRLLCLGTTGAAKGNTMNTIDERLGLPSASSMERYANCPASGAAEKLAQEANAVPEDPSIDEVAADGTLAHEWLAADMKDEPLLKAEIEARASAEVISKGQRLREKREAILEQWESNWRNKPHNLVFVERRFWATNKSGDKLFSAQPDLVVVSGKRAIVINYKAGWKDPAEAPGSWQIKAEVAVAYQNLGCESITGVIVTPTNTPIVGEWSKDGLEKNLQSVIRVAQSQSEKPGALNAGNWCRYCKARGICAEAAKMSVAVVPMENGVAVTDPVQAVKLMEPSALAEVWRKSTVIRAILDAVKGRLESMNDEELAVLGIGRKPGRNLAAKVNGTAAEVAERLGWSAEEMLPVLNISLPKLQDAWREKYGTTKDQAEVQVRFALKSMIEQGKGKEQLTELEK